jgi:DNA-binding winged helix-turn-helix (wHTH) protein/TolB-like protein/Tfp pilus assembly protein PilF
MLAPESGARSAFEFNDVLIDCENFRVVKNGAIVPLSPRAFDVLVFLVERRGRVVEKQEFFEALWKDTFVSDNALTKVIKTIRAALGDDAEAPLYIETVPKRGYRFIASLREDSPSEAAPAEATVTSVTIEYEPVSADKTPNSWSTRLSHLAHSRPIVVVASIVLLIVIVAFYWRQRATSSPVLPIKSLAVMPFTSTTNSPELDYLTEGLTEGLIENLSQRPHLAVKARSVVFRYQGKKFDPQVVGRQLGVQAVLLGRVTQLNDQLELNFELVDTASGNRLWGQKYTRRIDELMAWQNEIARDVFNTLSENSANNSPADAKSYTTNSQAYQLYLKGRFYWNKRTTKDVHKAIEDFTAAINLDPNYALAYAGLADAYAILSAYGVEPPTVLMPKAREAALKALELDDQLAEAHTALAYTLSGYDYEFANAEQELKRAIELNPHYATAHQFYGELLTHRGRPMEARAEFQRALELEPLSLIINRMYGESLYFSRHYDESILQLQKTIELDPNFSRAHYSLAAVYEMKGNYSASVAEFARFQELTGNAEFAATIRTSFAKNGWRGYLQTLAGQPRPAELSPSIAARVYADLGEKDRAFAELNRAFENHEFFLVWLSVDPRLDTLRDDRRFQNLLHRLGPQTQMIAGTKE